MRSAELTAYLVLGGLVALLWLGWLFRPGTSVWAPVVVTVLAGLVFLARLILLSVRQD